MGKSGGSYGVRHSRRDIRQRRLQVLSYMALAVLALATIVVVFMAIER